MIKANDLVSGLGSTGGLQAFYDLLLAKPRPTQGNHHTEEVQNIYLQTFDVLSCQFKSQLEACLLSLKIHNELLSRCSEISLFIPKLLPQLTELITEEYLDNESVHTQTCEIISSIVSVTEEFHLVAVLSSLLTLILELLENSFKEVKAKTCKNLSVLCKSIPSELTGYGEEIIDCLIHCLKHPDSNVRSSSLETIGHFAYVFSQIESNFLIIRLLSTQSDSFQKIIELTKDNVLSSMIRDENVQVRDMYYRVIADWLMHLPDRKQHQRKLIPILLIGLFDPIEEVRETCWEQVVELGITWESENPEKMRESNDGRVRFKPYPWHPFLLKPRYGVRGYFKGYFIENLEEILHEINNFISPHRDVGAKILLALLVLTEALTEKNMKRVLVSIMSAIHTESSPATLILYKSIEVIGRHISISSYLPIILSSRSKPSFFCTLVCSTAPIIPLTNQLISLIYLLKGSLETQDSAEILRNFSEFFRFARSISRSRESLFLSQVLIDSNFAWPMNCKREIFKLLIEHDHDSIVKYLKKLKDDWFSEDPDDLSECIDSMLKDLTKTSSSEWRCTNIHWPVFLNLCKHYNDYLPSDLVLSMFVKIFLSQNSPYHIPAMRLLKHMQLYTVEIVNNVLTKCLLGHIKTDDLSLLRVEALQLLKMSEHHNVEMLLFEALSACLDDEQINVQLDACDEIHRQFTFVKIYGVDSFTKAKDQSNIITKMMLKLISILDKGLDMNYNSLYPLIDVIGLFPEEIDINAKAWSLVLRRLVSILMDEDKGNLASKELAHLCIIAVTNSCKQVIIDELTSIAKNSDKKIADYIYSMLSSD